MDSIIYQDSPLAEFLEGEGIAEPEWAATTDLNNSPAMSADPPLDFAPRGASTLHWRLRDKLPQPLQIPLSSGGPVRRIHSACSRVVNANLGRADNERFLEHFRYLIVASHLLADRSGQTGFRSASARYGLDGALPTPADYTSAPTSVTGVAVVCGATFLLTWLVNWARVSKSNPKGLAVFGVFALVSCLIYLYIRKQWLLHLRQQAVESAGVLVTNLQAFEASTASALTFIQEVELISRGYRLSSPLPPITRLEEKDQSRRCARLRRTAYQAFAAGIPPFEEQCETLKRLIDQENLEKYLDVYDITISDLQEAALGFSEKDFEDTDSLKTLRTLQYRQDVLRRVYLCTLLAMEADGSASDFARWRAVIVSTDKLARLMGERSEKMNTILNEEEQYALPSPIATTPSPEKEKLRAQLRNLSSLSQGIRGLQAKMQVLREESTKSLERTDEVIELGSTLMSQYESIGTDLKSLMRAWEDGKAALALNIDRAERRVSATSSGLRSPALSLGGLTVVDEGSPFDALRALNGETPIKGGQGSSDEEVFEAISIPRQRPRLTAEQRKSKILENRARDAALREQRDATTSMMRELESVIRLRPINTRNSTGRITSI